MLTFENGIRIPRFDVFDTAMRHRTPQPAPRLALGGRSPNIGQPGIDIPRRQVTHAPGMPKRPNKRRLQRERVELYRRLVCEAAESVFADHGFAGARLDQIASASGVSIGTIYRVFPNRKREIYRELQDKHGTAAFDVSNTRGTLVYQQTGNLLKAMLAGIEASVEYFIAHPSFLQVILREEAAWTVGPRRGNAQQMALWTEAAKQTVMAMEMGIAEGTFVDEDPVAMARTWTAVHQAHLGYWLETGRKQTAAEVNARLRRQLMRSFCRPEAVARELADDQGTPMKLNTDRREERP